MIKCTVKVKSDDYWAVLKIVDEIRKVFSPNVTQSPLLESDPVGWHAYLTIYLEEEALSEPTGGKVNGS